MSNNETSKKALVVDDNPMMRVLLSSMLMHRGFQVVEERSAEGALNQLRDTEFDLVVLDIMLHGMSGAELCQIIRDELGLLDVPVVAYTARDPGKATQLRLAGFNGVIFKPVDGAALDELLDEVMSHA